ncbi:MAG: hypothetical protein JST92_24250 [Deltaproteobacteria bacterium]|nr:hypothetical protein [Deltaproteobacteria bacterium]
MSTDLPDLKGPLERLPAALSPAPAPLPTPERVEALHKPSEQDVEIARFRRKSGYALGVFSIVLLLGIGAFSLWSVDRALAERNAGTFTNLDLARVGLHGLITITLVWACYQLLRMAERLILPTNMLARADILLGNQATMPAEKLMEQLVQVLQMAQGKKDERLR